MTESEETRHPHRKLVTEEPVRNSENVPALTLLSVTGVSSKAQGLDPFLRSLEHRIS